MARVSNAKERKNTDLALFTEERLRLALQVAQMGTWDRDVVTNRITWSPETEGLFGLAGGSFGGTYDAFLACVHPDYREKVSHVVKHQIEKGESVWVEYPVMWPDGRLRWMAARAELLRDGFGLPRKLFGVVMDITERKQVEQAIHESENARRMLSEHLTRLQETERRHLARELHDTTAQNIAALGMRLEVLLGDVSDDRVRRALTESQALVEQCLSEIRTFSFVLHPPLLDELGLRSAISRYVKGFVERSGITVDFDGPEDLGRLPEEVETTLYRVVQESLSNIYLHSGSRTAEISIMRGPADVTLEVRDRGRGLNTSLKKDRDETPAVPGVGIASMKERVREVGGQFEIRFGNEGTSVRVVLPLPHRSR